MDSLTEKLLAEGTLSSADVAAATTPGDAAQTTVDAMSVDSKVPVNEEALTADSIFFGYLSLARRTTSPLADMVLRSGTVNHDMITKDGIAITSADKHSFLRAMLGGTPWTYDFSLYAGTLTGTLRARTTRETAAIIKETMRRRQDFSSSETVEHFSVAACLSIQLTSLCGVDSPDMPKLSAWLDKDGKTIHEPDWVPRIGILQDHLAYESILGELAVFEAKYWTLLSFANDQSFWHPGART